MINYVCGFLFNDNMTEVVLIEKNKPDWQKGLLNGVGGKVEPNESIYEAMSREFFEEAGLRIDPDRWTRFCNLDGRKDQYNEKDIWTVWFYFAKGPINDCSSMTSEKIVTIDSRKLHLYKIVPNLHWLIPLAKAENIYLPISIYAKK